MKEKPDRKLSGQMMAVLVRFFSTVQALFKTHEIEPDFFDWIEGSGRDLFEQKMGEMFEVYKSRLTIDGDAEPYRPGNWPVEYHRKMGQIEFNPSKIELWLSEAQKFGRETGKELRKKLEKLEGVMNANMLDGLLKNQHLIPGSWKGQHIFFWGTIYRILDDRLCVRYLYWDRDAWHWRFDYLDEGFNGCDPAALIRKS